MEIILDNYEDICHLVDTSKREFLKPEHSRQKSFYKKALVFDDGKAKVLVSYTTPVVVVIGNTFFKLQCDNRYTTSPTTMRHINEFLIQNGFKRMGVAEWRKVERF